MKREELYNKTVNILVDAYFNDTLEHGDCRSCAVGNIVAGNLGIKLIKVEDRVINEDFELENKLKDSGLWFEGIFGGNVWHKGLTEDVLWQMNATGYSPKEIAKIEYSFESSYERDDAFNGLMAVIEVLDEIHENTDTIITTSSKGKFIKTA